MEQGDQPRKRARLDGPLSPSTDVEHKYQQHDDTATPNGSDQVANGFTVQRDATAAREEKSGIVSFVDTGAEGFSGVMKTRYTDFLVNEILQCGQVLHLHSLDLPQKFQQSREKGTTETASEVREDSSHGDLKDARAQKANESASSDAQVPENNTMVSEEDREALLAIFGQQIFEQTIRLDAKVQRQPNKKARDFNTFRSDPIDDKQQRTTAHQLIRRVFASRIETTTEEDNTIKFAASPPRKKASNWSRNNADGRTRGKLGWDELGGENIHFTVYKENKDTMEIVHYLCTQFKVQPKSFAFAGTKDRRAVTVQRMSAYRIQAERLAGINKALRGARLGDFKYEQHGLELGDLSGNQFVIALRDCHFPGEEKLNENDRLALAEQVVKRAVSRFSANGFINYYGLQRFGSFEASTDAIGALLLQAKYKDAVDKLLEYSSDALASYKEKAAVSISSDESRRAGAIDLWRTTGDTDETLNILPRKYSAESNIIRYLSGTDKRTGKQLRLNDYQGALRAIARNLRLMYVHAYQSLVWNMAASKRWETYGDRVVEGDLVIVDNSKSVGAEQELDEQGEVIIRPAAHDSATTAEEAFERARPLSKDEAESGKFSIFDIVLPQPGYDVEYPKNAVGQFYKDFMRSERGGGLDPHNMRRDWKDVSLSGAYRPFLARPVGDVRFEVKQYCKDTAQLAETDMDRLVREGKVRDEMRVSRNSQTVDEEGTTQNLPHKIAVILQLQLASSQYATMALREMSKGGIFNYQPEYSSGS